MSEVSKNLRYDIFGELKHYQFAKDEDAIVLDHKVFVRNVEDNSVDNIEDDTEEMEENE